MLTCNESSECESNQICVNGVCTIKCKTDSDCASYQVSGANSLEKMYKTVETFVIRYF